MRRILEQIAAERTKQDIKWGEQNHPSFDEIFAGEAERREGLLPMALRYRVPSPFDAKELCDTAAQNGSLTWMHILVEEVAELLEAPDRASLREELIQTAAVAVAWVECLDRQSGREEEGESER